MRQKVHVIEGEVLDVKFNSDTLTFSYLVSYIGADDEDHQRWFSASEIEVDPDGKTTAVAVVDTAAEGGVQ